MKPPTLPSALPSVPITTGTRPVRPKCSSEPSPRAPSTPVACASSSITNASWRSAASSELRQRRDGAVHAEDGVGDDHPLAARRPSRRARGRGRRRRGGRRRARSRRRAGSRRRCSRGSGRRCRSRRPRVASAAITPTLQANPEPKSSAASRALEVGELALELAVELGVAGERTGSAAPGAVALERHARRLDDARVGGEAEVVVRAEQEPLSPLDHRAAGARGRDDDRRRAPRRPAAGRERLGQEAVEPGGHRATHAAAPGRPGRR